MVETIMTTSTKDAVIALIKSLPDNVTLEDIMYHLYVKEKILKGQKQLTEGHSYSQEEIEDQVEQWLK